MVKKHTQYENLAENEICWTLYRQLVGDLEGRLWHDIKHKIMHTLSDELYEEVEYNLQQSIKDL